MKESKKEKIIRFNKEHIYIGNSRQGYGLTYFTKKNIKKGDVVMMGFGKIIDHQTAKISIQIKNNKHYIPNLWTGRYWNHSCEPNVFPRTRADGFPNWIALRNLNADEEITYGYWGTEYQWSQYTDEKKIRCECQSLKCKGRIQSFSELDSETKKRILKNKLCSDYLHDLSTGVKKCN